jgi:hypothetical protein
MRTGGEESLVEELITTEIGSYPDEQEERSDLSAQHSYLL